MSFLPVPSELSFPRLEEEILAFWRESSIFAKSLRLREGGPEFVFYEGPPTANSNPGVHHVQARSYKDLFPRYKTMRGFHVARKAGWDCHGLPVEIQVEKKLGFSGKKAIEEYGIAEFNRRCRESVMEYEGAWRRMTERIAFWVDMDDAYMTMSNPYIESVWWSLRQLWDKGLIYQGFKVVPFCARDSTPLSSHEVGLGYEEVEDPSIYVRFPLLEPGRLGLPERTSLLVWTTTPWTLPGNTACAVNPRLGYVAVRQGEEVLILAEALLPQAVGEGAEVLARFQGSDLAGVSYEAPYRYFSFDGKKGHYVVTGDFVSAEDGTGIVHIAPAFGADDLEMAQRHDLPVVHSVEPDGRFRPEVTLVAGLWFKDADPVIIQDLAERGRLWRRQSYLHSYPHCWRCGSPLMYYATHSWFINNTRLKDRLIELNQTIDWHPPHIKEGRYGDWLRNLVDWALSRTRYWGTPLPIWICKGCGEREMMGSFAELAERSKTPIPDLSYPHFDPHRPYVDQILLTCRKCGEDMERVPDVIDVWYDSGAMPFAQFHYPFENVERFRKAFPADFICEGLDQTRGWFNSLHQLATMLFDSVAYRTVICHGLVLDAEGEKMSKSRGNVVDPWEVLDTHGADALRWYLYTSAPPEVSRRFSVDLVGQARRNLLIWWNTYHFFVLYANAAEAPLEDPPGPADRPLLDRWILARLNHLVGQVTERLDAFDVTAAARMLESFVTNDLSQGYVRLTRPRFWREDRAAFATLWECLVTLCKLGAPFIPFMTEAMYRNLVRHHPGAPESVHLCDWPEVDRALLDPELMEQMEVVWSVIELGRAARTAARLRLRQPLAEMKVRLRGESDRRALDRFRETLLEELNVKALHYLEPGQEFASFKIKPNLPLLGKKYGKLLPAIRQALETADPAAVARRLRAGEAVHLFLEGHDLALEPEEILVEETTPEGYSQAEDASGLLVAVSTLLDEALVQEGNVRDLIRSVQDLRKKADLHVSDRIELWLVDPPGQVERAVRAYESRLLEETLTVALRFGEPPPDAVVDGARVGSEAPFRIGLRRVWGPGAEK